MARSSGLAPTPHLPVVPPVVKTRASLDCGIGGLAPDPSREALPRAIRRGRGLISRARSRVCNRAPRQLTGKISWTQKLGFAIVRPITLALASIFRGRDTRNLIFSEHSSKALLRGLLWRAGIPSTSFDAALHLSAGTIRIVHIAPPSVPRIWCCRAPNECLHFPTDIVCPLVQALTAIFGDLILLALVEPLIAVPGQLQGSNAIATFNHSTQSMRNARNLVTKLRVDSFCGNVLWEHRPVSDASPCRPSACGPNPFALAIVACSRSAWHGFFCQWRRACWVLLSWLRGRAIIPQARPIITRLTSAVTLHSVVQEANRPALAELGRLAACVVLPEQHPAVEAIAASLGFFGRLASVPVHPITTAVGDVSGAALWICDRTPRLREIRCGLTHHIRLAVVRPLALALAPIICERHVHDRMHGLIVQGEAFLHRLPLRTIVPKTRVVVAGLHGPRASIQDVTPLVIRTVVGVVATEVGREFLGILVVLVAPPVPAMAPRLRLVRRSTPVEILL
mmetsp:Transcript_4794/g.10313  ORF Transcript_4794/g.10313 Transcript_4794/m.10313 type:complete len:510 (-) Transcript_4794:1034-2563(-)